MSIDSRKARRVGALAVAMALVAAGCGTGTSATSEWKQPQPVDLPYRHVLVIGVSPNSRVRRGFEEQMVDAIVKGGTKATGSIFAGSAMGSEALTPENVKAMVASTGADAVLVTKLLTRTTKMAETQQKVDIKAQPSITITEEPGLTTVFASDYTMTIEPTELMVKSKATIEATLFDVADKGRLVYRVAVNSKFEEETGDEVLDIVGNIADAIAGELRRDKLVL